MSACFSSRLSRTLFHVSTPFLRASNGPSILECLNSCPFQISPNASFYLRAIILQPKPSSLTPPQDSGNKVSRKAAITGTANITLGGKTVIMADVQLRGDLKPTRPMPSQSGKETTPISINIGRCTVISTGSVIKPPARISRGQVHYYPMKIGDNVFVGKCCDLLQCGGSRLMVVQGQTAPYRPFRSRHMSTSAPM